MATRTGTAHVVTTVRKYKDRVYRTHLLRRSYREGGSVKNETLGNLSHLPDDLVDIIRASAWLPAAIRSSPNCAHTSAKRYWQQPRSISRRSKLRWRAQSLPVRTRSGCRWVKSSTSTRSLSISYSISVSTRLPSSANTRASLPKPRSTASTSFAPQ